jgi:RNA polymerase sigma factor (sigma-70 family)
MSILRHQVPTWFRQLLLFAQSDSFSSHDRVKEGAATLVTQFEVFFKRYERQITGYLCRMVGDEQTALDLSQETFVRAWQHFDNLQESSTARAWLYRVSTNLALRHLEQYKNHPVFALDDTTPGASDPGRHIVEQDRVQEVMMTLTPNQRSTLILHDVCGFSCEEIAKLLQLSYEAVKKTLSRSREQFRVRYLHGEASE